EAVAVAVGVVAAAEVVAAEVVVVGAVGDEVPADHQDRVGNGHGRLLLAYAAGEAPELGGQVGVAGTSGGPCALIEDVDEPHVAFGAAARAARAAGDVVARCDARPRRQVPGCGNLDMSTPISARIASAARFATPGMVPRWSRACSKGMPASLVLDANTASISVSRRAMVASR